MGVMHVIFSHCKRLYCALYVICKNEHIHELNPRICYAHPRGSTRTCESLTGHRFYTEFSKKWKTQQVWTNFSVIFKDISYLLLHESLKCS